jgi:hypothetical protein
MLFHLGSTRTGVRKVRRQLRLFACACCRQVSHLTTNDRLRTAIDKAVEVCEQFTDGKATRSQLDAAVNDLRPAYQEAGEAVAQALANLPADVTDAERGFAERIARLPEIILSVIGDTTQILRMAGPIEAERAAWSVAAFANAAIHDSQLTLVSCIAEGCGSFGLGKPNLTHCHLLRDIVGTPFRSFLVYPSWLHFHDGTVPKIAQRIYDNRDFSLLPILADALEEAGCDNDDILRHCREPGEHVRGCWVVDLLRERA